MEVEMRGNQGYQGFARFICRSIEEIGT